MDNILGFEANTYKKEESIIYIGQKIHMTDKDNYLPVYLLLLFIMCFLNFVIWLVIGSNILNTKSDILQRFLLSLIVYNLYLDKLSI